ncbi:MAG: hypothetical protein ABI572_00525 [Actinomycetota bacterium]
MLIDDVWKTIEATLGNLTPTKARDLAKGFAEPGAAKEQVAKTAADLMEWSQHNRERVRSLVTREISDQISHLGLAPQSDLDALKKRVRELERAAGMTASGRSGEGTAAKKPAARTPGTRKPTARKTTARAAVTNKPAAPSGQAG